jgi:hypothetical protein
MKKFLFYILLSVLTMQFIGLSGVSAAKKFIRKPTLVKNTSAQGIPAIVRYRSDKQGILLSLSNFNGLESISYSFTYETNGVAQGAGGNITASNNPTTQRELIFGTCSTSVCRYHYNLSNARLLLSAKYTNGRTATKTYRIKTYQ